MHVESVDPRDTRWEDAQRPEHGGRAFTLYVSIERDGQPGLVRLAGVDPTRVTEDRGI